MDFETLRSIIAPYNIEITQADMPLLLAIAHLPTSDILQMFNDITIEDIFTKKEGLF